MLDNEMVILPNGLHVIICTWRQVSKITKQDNNHVIQLTKKLNCRWSIENKKFEYSIIHIQIYVELKT